MALAWKVSEMEYRTTARVERRRWDSDDYYHIIQVQVDGYGLKDGDEVDVVIRKIEPSKEPDDITILPDFQEKKSNIVISLEEPEEYMDYDPTGKDLDGHKPPTKPIIHADPDRITPIRGKVMQKIPESEKEGE